jgi:DNA-binding response OmpR family regulator
MSLPTILVVDDDPNILRLVRQALETEGFEVSTAVTGQQALNKLTRELPNLAIVDIKLPDIDGFEVCRRIQQYAIIPVVMLTGIDNEDTIVDTLDRYAEDYIVKPFNGRELAARVRRVLRRFGDVQTTSSSAEIMVDEGLRINFGQHWADVRNTRQDLTPTESKLLHMLVRHAGQVLTTDALLARVWSPEEEVYVEGLRVHIRRLREKIEPDASKPTYILTERGVGYRFKAFTQPQIQPSPSNVGSNATPVNVFAPQ